MTRSPFPLRAALRAGVCLALFAVAMPGLAAGQTVLNRGNDTDPATLDHHRTSTVSESTVLRDLYEGLVVEAADGEVIPGVAERWDVSDDGRTYTFHLRENARWSNGDPVTAGDFAFAFRRIMDPATAAGYASILFPILNAEAVNSGATPVSELGVVAIDDRTLEVRLETPTPFFTDLLTHQTALPLHQASVEEFGDAFTQPGNLVSNGAYMLQSFTPNDQIVLVKNPEFHDAANVAIDQVNYIPFEDRSACLRRFEAGEVQICSDVPAEQMAYLQENLADQLRVAPYLGSYYLPVKVGKEKLADPRVRQAISLVIDRDFIADQVWQGTMLPAYGFVPPGIANYVEPQPALDYAGGDLLDREDRAVALLEEAGVEPGSLEIQLSYNSSENHRNTMAAIADMLSNIGITASLNEMEGTGYFNFLREGGDFDIARAGWIGDYNDPQNFLYIFGSDVSFNYPGWKSPEFDAKLQAAAETSDLAARAEILAEAERLVIDALPGIPILYYSSRALVADEVEGWEDNILDSHGTRWLSFAS